MPRVIVSKRFPSPRQHFCPTAPFAAQRNYRHQRCGPRAEGGRLSGLTVRIRNSDCHNLVCGLRLQTANGELFAVCRILFTPDARRGPAGVGYLSPLRGGPEGPRPALHPQAGFRADTQTLPALRISRLSYSTSKTRMLIALQGIIYG